MRSGRPDGRSLLFSAKRNTEGLEQACLISYVLRQTVIAFLTLPGLVFPLLLLALLLTKKGRPRAGFLLTLGTDATHAYRARRCFETVGFTVVSAPVARRRPEPAPDGLLSFVPWADSLEISSECSRELFGRMVYQVLYY